MKLMTDFYIQLGQFRDLECSLALLEFLSRVIASSFELYYLSRTDDFDLWNIAMGHVMEVDILGNKLEIRTKE